MPTQLGPALPRVNRGLHFFACFTAVCTLILVFAGGLVTSTGSGLAVPDWPLAFGLWFPEMTGGVLFEHGHRMVATFVGLLTVILAIWVVILEERVGVRALGVVAVITVIIQGILGGITVLYKLPPQVSVAHACLAQAFLCMTVTLAVVTGPGFIRRVPTTATAGLRRAAVATTAAIYAQLILGAVMRHTGAGLAIRDFPLSMGRLIPPLDDILVKIHYSHRVGALGVLLLVGVTVALVLGGEHGRWLRWPAIFLGLLVAVQIALGALTVWTGKPPVVTTTHVAVGALLLATSLVLALRAYHAEEGPSS